MDRSYRVAICVLIALFLLSCNAEKYATKKLYKIYSKNGLAVAKLCADTYHPLEKSIDTVIYKKGVPVWNVPEVRIVDCDSIIKNKQNPNVKISLPAKAVITDTIIVYKERYLVNKAKLLKQEVQYKELNNEFVKCRTQRNWLWKVLLIVSIYTLLRWMLRFWNIRLP